MSCQASPFTANLKETVTGKLVSLITDDDALVISFVFANSQHKGKTFEALITKGTFDPLYSSFDLLDSNSDSLVERSQECDDACNLEDQIIEFIASTLEVDTDSLMTLNYNAQIQ